MSSIPPDPPPLISPTIVPSTPDPAMTTLVAALLRHILTIASGAGLVSGTYSDHVLVIVASGIVGAGTVGWSIWQKIQAARADHTNSVQSIRFQRPVKVG